MMVALAVAKKEGPEKTVMKEEDIGREGEGEGEAPNACERGASIIKTSHATKNERRPQMIIGRLCRFVPPFES